MSQELLKELSSFQLVQSLFAKNCKKSEQKTTTQIGCFYFHPSFGLCNALMSGTCLSFTLLRDCQLFFVQFRQSNLMAQLQATGSIRYFPHQRQFGATSFTDELGGWTLRTWRIMDSPISEVGIKSFRPRARVSP